MASEWKHITRRNSDTGCVTLQLRTVITYGGDFWFLELNTGYTIEKAAYSTFDDQYFLERVLKVDTN